MSHKCRELLLIINITISLGQAVGLPIGDTTMNISIHEDNAGALILAEVFPPKFTPRIKYYASKTILFREEINKRVIKLLNIDTAEKLRGIFNKLLPRKILEYIWNKIMGW